MGAIQKADRPVGYPGHTVWRAVKGPVVYVGELITGVFVYLDERESREVVRAWGWPTKEQHDELKAERDKLAARLAELEQEVKPLRALESAVTSLTERRSRRRVPASKSAA
jgi:hypothetical protein